MCRVCPNVGAKFVHLFQMYFALLLFLVDYV